MAYTVTGQKHPDNEAERLDMLLRPFSIIGSVVIGWVNKLGSATLFLFLYWIKETQGFNRRIEGEVNPYFRR